MSDLLAAAKRIPQSKYGPILTLLTVMTLIGFVTVDRYGVSWDEYNDSLIGQGSLRAFYSSPDYTVSGFAGTTGPAFFMIAEIGTSFFGRLRPDWLPTDARHFTYFLTFELGVFFLYTLCRRFASRPGAFAATALFATQPLLLGHAFINPKDTPFMSLCIAAMALGFALVEAFERDRNPPLDRERDQSATQKRFRHSESIREEWQTASPRRKGLVIGLTSLALIATVEILVLHRLILPIALRTIHNAYFNTSTEFVNTVFQRLAENAALIPVTDYLWKITRIYWLLRLPVALALAFIATIALVRTFPNTVRRMASTGRFRDTVTAAVALGLVISTRTAGLFVGALVGAFLILEHRLKAIKPLTLYGILAAITSFITRPYFWDHPLERIPKSLSSVSTYTLHSLVLFRGDLYPLENLPKEYSPFTIFPLQLTEPLLILIPLGGVLALRRAFRRNTRLLPLGVISLWMALPLALFYLIGIPRYDNFRHLLFTLPPLFILASIGLDALFGRIRARGWNLIIASAALVPGLVAIVTLYPYPYIYYNSLVKGVAGAFRSYELDYWCTSVREGVEYVNAIAAPGAAIVVSGQPLRSVREFLRPDLSPVGPPETPSERYEADTAILCARRNEDLKLYPEAEVLWSVQRQGAVLAVVKDIGSLRLRREGITGPHRTTMKPAAVAGDRAPSHRRRPTTSLLASADG